MKGIIQPARGGRPSKVTKPTGAPRAKVNRRIGAADGLSNQDPDLEQHDVTTDDDFENDHGATFDSEAAAVAAAAAAAQQHHHHQHNHQQVELTAASILASSVQGSADQHPDLSGHLMEGGNGGVQTTEELAHRSGYINITIESALAKRLAREPGMRVAHQRRASQKLNLVRRSNVEALFAHIAGAEAPQPCKNCHKGHGPWTSCVVIDGQMCGSCANCWFNASGARCSFHETRNPQSHGAQIPNNDGFAYSMAPAPAPAIPQFNFASISASTDPVVRFTVEQAMAQVRGADRTNRLMMMIDATSKQLAYQICLYEEAIREQQNQVGQPGPSGTQAAPQGVPQSVSNEQEAP
ncbi:uncharacterized protein F4812DRAFT_333802 [Daldinia caldariorum]|uniref:uncharacterized protein n=1 Tax=Daldinia caldariorum TaxID=326644 RepID=UPI0020079ADB|nr:uncharacterized protein F4812DRAFT_333802 [Daldinia caldariorum]KAI1469530.1 hypothetical protein F4812DRAFT_333802 [Daldinia caldariorum]